MSTFSEGLGSVATGRRRRIALILGLVAAAASACGGGTTDPSGTPSGDELPVSWAVVVSPPGSFSGYSCGLTVAGSAYCWGEPPGIGQSRRPILVPGGHTFSMLSAGPFIGCGLAPQGRAVCWGHLAGTNEPARPPAVLDTLAFSTLSVGYPYTCGLVQQRLYCHHHLLTAFRAHADSVRFQAVASGPAVVCALDLDGAARCWGPNGSGLQPEAEQVVRGPVPFRALSIGIQRCAIAIDDAIYCWGAPGESDAPVGGRVSAPLVGGHRFRSISVGEYYACGVTLDDAAWCWGSNHSGQFGTGVVQPQDTNIPVRVTGGNRFSSIAAGWATTCGVTTDRMAFCWGDAKNGQVGDASPQQPVGARELRLVPTRVANPLR